MYSHARKLPAKRAFPGLTGSSLVRVRAVSPQAPQPPTKKPILVHFCFNQEAGETKPPRCNCHVHVTEAQAYEFIDAGRAHFLLVRNPKTPKLTKNHRAIVVQRHTVDGQTLYALAALLKADRRDARYAAIKAQTYTRRAPCSTKALGGWCGLAGRSRNARPGSRESFSESRTLP